MMVQDTARAAYVAIATRRFARMGYHGASLATLAADAGVTKQALLHFFGTKARLYGEVLEALATRQIGQIEAAADPDPVAHLKTYFASFRATSFTAPDDVRLVVRALLDAESTARHWPMKPYLQHLMTLIGATPRGHDLNDAARLAWLSRMIGEVQYTAISAPAVAGMFGDTVAAEIKRHVDCTMDSALHSSLENGP